MPCPHSMAAAVVQLPCMPSMYEGKTKSQGAGGLTETLQRTTSDLKSVDRLHLKKGRRKMPVLAACLADSTSFIAQRTSHEDRNIQHTGRWPLATCGYLSQKYGAAKELAFCFLFNYNSFKFHCGGAHGSCICVCACACTHLCAGVCAWSRVKLVEVCALPHCGFQGLNSDRQA